MFDIGNEETMCPRGSTLDSDTRAADSIDARVWRSAVVFIRAIDSHLGRAAGEGDQAISFGSILVNITRSKSVCTFLGDRGPTYVTNPWVGSAS